jgi:hypothetical protein
MLCVMCVGDSVGDPNSLFSDSDPQHFLFRIRILRLILYFDTKFFKMVPLIAFICVLESVRQRKKFSNWKTYVFFFSFKCLICDFAQKFLFYNNAWIQIRIRTFIGFGYNQNIFGFFRIRIHNTASPAAIYVQRQAYIGYILGTVLCCWCLWKNREV